MLIHIEFIKPEDLDPKNFNIGLNIFGNINNAFGGEYIDPMQELRRIYTQNIYPEYIGEGIYDAWNMEIYFAYCKTHELKEANVVFDGISAFGICDKVGDVLDKFGKYLNTYDSQYIIELCSISKNSKSHIMDSWKWADYGEYIGKQLKTTEILKDEPDIEMVYLFKILEVSEKVLDNG